MTKGKRLCVQIMCLFAESSSRKICQRISSGMRRRPGRVPHCQRSAQCQSESGWCDCMWKGKGQAKSWSKWPCPMERLKFVESITDAANLKWIVLAEIYLELSDKAELT